MTTSSQCNTDRTCLPLPTTTRENTSLTIHVVQKITIIRAQKIGKFAVWNLILCTDAIWRRREKFEYGCTLYNNIPSPISPKSFFRIARLNRLSVRTKRWPYLALLVPPVRTWKFFVAPCIELAKYFHTYAHLQYNYKVKWYSRIFLSSCL